MNVVIGTKRIYTAVEKADLFFRKLQCKAISKNSKDGFNRNKIINLKTQHHTETAIRLSSCTTRN